ncbi:MAG: DNA methyltransferase [Thermoplasmatales archaeon]
MRPVNKLEISSERLCNSTKHHINSLTAKEWIKAQVAIQEFYYEGRDVQNKNVHPATFPVSLPKHLIKLFTHEGESVLDPFVGIGSTLLAARDLNRNAVGFSMKQEYINYAKKRLSQDSFGTTKQLAIHYNARNIPQYLEPGTVSLSITSPPYANMLNHPQKNKSIRGNLRENEHYLKVQQYSNDPLDLGGMNHEQYSEALTEIYSGIYDFMKPKSHVVINVNGVLEDNKRYATHVYVIHAIEKAGFEFRNTIMWDKRNLMNKVGIFGWPNNYIALRTTMEFILDFWKRR